MNNSLSTLVQGLRSGEQPLLAYLEELEVHFNKREPAVLAFVPEEGRFKRLRREAEALLAQYPQPEERPPLFGAPVGVKDIFHVDGLPTRAGSRLDPDLLASPEASSVRRLKAAGALVLGKSVSTEFAYYAPGPTRNAHNPEHTPGGSSSGSAAAVAAHLCPLALGTQTIGSMIRPAAFNGVFGYKPTYDRIARDGVIPLSPSLDHVGIFASKVRDGVLAALLLVRDWRPAASVKRPVLAVPQGPYLKMASAEGLAHFEGICRRLSAAGYTVKEVAALADFEAVVERHLLILAAEAAQVHAGWYEEYGHLYHERTAELIWRGWPIEIGALVKALAGRLRLRRELSALMADHQIDLWIAPAAPGAAPHGLDRTGDPIMNLPWTQAGLPCVSLPSGWAGNGLPLGLQLIGHWNQDEKLLAYAVDIESVVMSN